MDAPITLHVRGTGGATFEMDVPQAGTHERERFVQRLELGELIALDDDGDPIDRLALVAELSPPEPDDVDADPFAGATVKELRAFAEEHGIALGDARSKAAILAVLHAADNDDD